MKKILVTGGAGNIGSSLVKGLLKTERYHISIVDNLSTGSKANLPQINESHWEFINCDVNTLDQLKKVFKKNSFHYIFHYAALVGVERTQKNPLKVLEDIEGIKNILNLAVEFNAERIFYSSSSEVYGEPVEIPQNEITTPLNSKLPYAIVKSVGESFMRTFHEHHQLDFTIMRFFNTYGPRQKNDFVISKFIELALQNKDITIYGDGSQTRSFLHVDDNVEFTIHILEKKKLLNEVVNVGSDIEITIIDLANLIIKILKSQSNIIFLPPLKEGDMTRRKPDTIANTHKHVNSWWSACYYLQDESEINLEKDIPQIYVNPTVSTRLNGLARTIKAKKGTLLVFPSEVLHTPVLHEKNLRYSLAMNFMPLGIVGEGDSTYEYR